MEEVVSGKGDTMITVIGSLNMDLVTYASRLPKIGETIIGKSFKQLPGGKGANQADAIAKLGVAVKMVGCIGKDELGDKLINALQKDGVDTTYVATVKEISTGIAAITVDAEGKNCIIVVPGANSMLAIQKIQKAFKAIEEASVVVAQLEVPIETVKYSLKAAKQLGKTTILNPAPAVKMDDEMLACVDILIPNETELEAISGIKIRTDDDLYTAAQLLIAKGVRELIITLGEKGCIHLNRHGSSTYKAFKVKAVDTTAAGDGFIGALAVAISEGKTLADAIVFATAVGALTVTKEGAQSALPLRTEVEAFIRNLA